MDPKPASLKQIKEWKKLLMGKFRKKEKLFLAEGIRCVEQILHNGIIEVEEILTDESGVIQQIQIPESLPVYELSDDHFAAISDTETPQGIIAVCKIPVETSIGQVKNRPGIIAAFDTIQDPGNLGTMIRTAAWFGVQAVVIGNGCADPFHPKVVRSTAGGTGVVPWMKGELSECLNELEKQGRKIALLDGSDRAANLTSTKPAPNTVLVVGNEANGISAKLFTAERSRVRIPGNNQYVESLNASVAFSIALQHISE